MKKRDLRFLVVLLCPAMFLSPAPLEGAGANRGIPAGLPFFSQMAGGWEDDLVGSSGKTIREIGCAIVCTAMLAKYYGKDTDPGRLNAWLSANSGYTPNGSIYWAKPAEYSGGTMQYMASSSWTSSNIATDNDRWAELNRQLDNGYPVIVKVDAYPSTPELDEHWVLVTWREGDSYYINDPYNLTYDPTDLLSRFYDATYDNTFFAMRVYHGGSPLPDYADARWVAAASSNYTDAGRSGTEVRWIVIHTTEGTYDSAIARFENPTSGASAHYVIGRDGSITQMVRNEDIGWHAGNWPYNERSIGIEHERYGTSNCTQAQYEASAALVKWLAARCDLALVHPSGVAPPDPSDGNGIIGHNQVPDPDKPWVGGGANHHTDPVNWDWDGYMTLLRQGPYPRPRIVSVNYPSSVNLGEWAQIEVIARNEGVATSWQSIHLSFRDISGTENMAIVSHDLTEADAYAAGTVMQAAYGTTWVTLSYAVAGGAGAPWEGGVQKYLKVKVKPERAGRFAFYVKSVAYGGALGNGGEGWSADPDSGIKDQQDEYVYEHSLAVGPSATISDAWWTNEVDGDGDGYVRSAALNYMLEVSEGSGNVSVELQFYCKREGSTAWEGMGGGSFGVLPGASYVQQRAVVVGVHGEYDWKIEMTYRTDQSVGYYTRDPSNDEHLNNYKMETAPEDVSYIITGMAGPGGSISPAGSFIVQHGSSQAFSMTPNLGYHIEDVVVDGASVGAAASWLFIYITRDHTIQAAFAIKTYMITATVTAGGSIWPSGSVIVEHGRDETFNVTPNAGYHIEDVVVDGASVGAVTSWEFVNVTCGHTIQAVFAMENADGAQKQQEILSIADAHRGAMPAELVLAIIRQEGGEGAFHTEGWRYNSFYLETDAPWAQPTNGDGIMQVTSASGYHEKSGPYTHDPDGYDHAIHDGCDYLMELFGTYGTFVQTALHYNSGPNTLYIYLGLQVGDRNYLSHVADKLWGFVPLTYGLRDERLAEELRAAQDVLDRYLYDMGIPAGLQKADYAAYQTELDRDLFHIGFRRLTTVSVEGQEVTASWPTRSGSLYQLQCCDDLATPGWNNVGQPVSGTGGIVHLLDPGGFSIGTRFYRVYVLP